MQPITQIKKLAGTFVFNQFLYPRDTFISDQQIFQDEGVGDFLQKALGDEAEKITFALEHCSKNLGPVLDLANNQGRLAVYLVEQGIVCSTVDSSSVRISSLRQVREGLTLKAQALFQIYPLDTARFEIDEKFQTVFASHQALEQSESELKILGTLRNILAHLKPEASVFLEVHNPDFLENRWNFREGIWTYLSERGEKFQDLRVWERTSPGSKESQTVFEYAVSKNLREFSCFRSILHLFNLDQWQKLFEVAGFLVEDCWGNWSKSPVSWQHPQLIFHLKSRESF
jgi:Methyltransferase domain